MIGFCLDKNVQDVVPGIKPKDIYESFRIDPKADIPVGLIREKIKFLLGKINDK